MKPYYNVLKATSDTIPPWGSDYGYVRLADTSRDSWDSCILVGVPGASERATARKMLAVTLNETRRRKPLLVHTPGIWNAGVTNDGPKWN